MRGRPPRSTLFPYPTLFRSTIAVSKAGFNVKEQAGVPLALNEIGRVDITLTVGGVAEKVDVRGELVMVETEQGRVSGRIDGKQLKELPLNGRNILNLVAIQ